MKLQLRGIPFFLQNALLTELLSKTDIQFFIQNALLASKAEVEQQSEMDERVSTWKERIEVALEEQVS
jgi:transposase